MLTNNEKRIIENMMESLVLASPSGINTRTLMQVVYRILHSRIPNMNMHHIAGMLS